MRRNVHAPVLWNIPTSGLQLEGRLIQTSDPNLDERVAGVGRVQEPRPTAGAEAATVIA